jgi:hypothetical protein
MKSVFSLNCDYIYLALLLKTYFDQLLEIKSLFCMKCDPNFHTRSITGCVLGDAGSESASTIKTRMKFITFRLAGWLVRLSSWVPISAGGGLSDFGVAVEVSSENC